LRLDFSYFSLTKSRIEKNIKINMSLRDEYSKAVLYRYGSVYDDAGINSADKNAETTSAKSTDSGHSVEVKNYVLEQKKVKQPRKDSKQSKKDLSVTDEQAIREEILAELQKTFEAKIQTLEQRASTRISCLEKDLEKVGHLKDEFTTVVNENSLLKTTLSGYEQEAKQLSDKVSQLVPEEKLNDERLVDSSPNAQYERMACLVAAYEEEKENLKRQLAEVNGHKKVLKSNVFQMQEEKEGAEIECAALKEKLSASERQILELAAALEAKKAENEHHDDVREARMSDQAREEELAMKLARSEAEKQALEEEKEHLLAKVKSATEDVESSRNLVSKLSELEEEKKTALRMNEDLLAQLKSMTSAADEHETLKSGLDKAEEEKQALQADLKAAKETMMTLVEEAKIGSKQRETLKQTNEEMEASLKAAKEAMEGLVGGARLEDANTQEKEKLQREIDDSKTQLLAKDQQHALVKEKFLQLQKAHESLEKAYSEIKNKHTSANSELKRAQTVQDMDRNHFSSEKTKNEKKIAELEANLERAEKELFESTHDMNQSVEQEVEKNLKEHTGSYKIKVLELETKLKEAVLEGDIARNKLKESEITLRTNQRKLKTLEKSTSRKISEEFHSSAVNLDSRHERFEELESKLKRYQSFGHILMLLIAILLVAYYAK